MGRRRKGEPPAYRRHKASGQAYCTVAGEQVYLGQYGSPESRRAYRRIVREWEAAQERPVPAFTARPGCTVASLCESFLEHARLHYRDHEGKPTSELNYLRVVTARLLENYGEWMVDDFGAAELKSFRQSLLTRGLARSSANAYVHRVRRVFRWGHGETPTLVEATTLASLDAVTALPEGRGLRETGPVPTAPEGDVTATLAHLPEPWQTMVRLHRLIGCRPGELCRMRPREVDRQGVARVPTKHGIREVKVGGGVWVWQPTKHKTRWRGKTQIYLIGPQAQLLLRPLLTGLPDVCLFRGTTANAGESVAVNTYRWHVLEACAAANVPPWTPGQLRHNVSTMYDQAAGIETSSVILGHESVATTALYTEKNLRAAAEHVQRLG